MQLARLFNTLRQIEFNAFLILYAYDRIDNFTISNSVLIVISGLRCIFTCNALFNRLICSEHTIPLLLCIINAPKICINFGKYVHQVQSGQIAMAFELKENLHSLFQI
ncbi:hypothetical protein T4A_8732 [Trichinella pseudospiralis]|uniref:Uncharacterized protein n=1 Tax=Trichinella pseudospiralis TaxID=6337 RepID=A0A0V1JQK8_TRIPS|nr:hypothetical protein T4A_8732 [Trichinella pseudospiralis]KRZ37222.1 hypothetical protein T4C_6129 [Trichinella pseudospiralis]